MHSSIPDAEQNVQESRMFNFLLKSFGCVCRMRLADAAWLIQVSFVHH